MCEEQVTRAILKLLLSNDWQIISFDFPQSGTGKILHPNENAKSKNKNSIIPDIVATKKGVCIFSENKDRFFRQDYEKQHALKIGNDYGDAISLLLENYFVNVIYYGIGLPTAKYKRGAINAANLVDFVLCVDEDFKINFAHNPHNILF